MRATGVGFALTLHENVLDLPRTWKKPRRIFVNSMSEGGQSGGRV